MAPPGKELAPQVVAACLAGASEASSSFARCLGASITLAPSDCFDYHVGSPPQAMQEAGLALVLHLDGGAAVVLIPESTGLLPDWYLKPDATGESKLATLAQELGMVLLPEEQMPLDFAAGAVADLAGAVERGGAGANSSCVPLEITGAKGGSIFLLWPLSSPAQVIPPKPATPAPPATKPAEPKAVETKAAESKAAAVAASVPPPSSAADPGAGLRFASPPPSDNVEERIYKLPPYTRSILRIEVPVRVTLATTQLPLKRIVELGPGSIIQFEKPCDSELSLQVGEHEVAIGEAVKVGEKFGLRLTSMVMPPERFFAVRGKRVDPNKKP